MKCSMLNDAESTDKLCTFSLNAMTSCISLFTVSSYVSIPKFKKIHKRIESDMLLVLLSNYMNANNMSLYSYLITVPAL